MPSSSRPYGPELQAAMDLWHSGDPEAAISKLEALAVLYPDVATVRGVLGDYLWGQGGLNEALPHCEAAVRLSPASERAARQYFHVLYELGHVADALAELKRFRSTTTIDEFRREWSKLVADVERQLGES